MQHKITCLWKEPSVPETYRTGVSLHSHTNHSKEGLNFIADYIVRYPLLRRVMAAQAERAKREKAITVDFWQGYWTPPLPPLAAFELEKDQIERELGLSSMVSITDHDNIEAPMLLRVVPEARRVPVSVEWTVPFLDTAFHLGVHNLPSGSAESIMERLSEFTLQPAGPSSKEWRKEALKDLLKTLSANPDVLIVLNHPLWDLAGVGAVQHERALGAFLRDHGECVHALELSGIRSWEENRAVKNLSEAWNQLLISGGDRHGCEPNAALNLTNAESFTEFVHEVRGERRSHVLFMPQYAQPNTLRHMKTLLDVIREYPDYSHGSRHWDERAFHPDHDGVIRPLAALWEKPPFYIRYFFSTLRLLDTAPARSAMRIALAKPRQAPFGSAGQEEGAQ